MSNRLKDEKSPYLLQHKENPVDWYPWGKDAFERADREEKPTTRRTFFLPEAVGIGIDTHFPTACRTISAMEQLKI